MLQLRCAQGGRVHPATFGVEQATTGQGHTGHCFSLFAIQALKQLRVEGIGQHSLALVFLAIEGQLQDAASVPVSPALQGFEQTSGVAKTAEYQARQSRAMGRKLEVQHPLRVA